MSRLEFEVIWFMTWVLSSYPVLYPRPHYNTQSEVLVPGMVTGSGAQDYTGLTDFLF